MESNTSSPASIDPPTSAPLNITAAAAQAVPIVEYNAPTAADDLRPWHELWNPLGLRKTASPAQTSFEKLKLFIYFYKSAISDKVAACIPLLVLFGEPESGGGSVVYFFLVGATIVFAFLFTLLHFNTVASRTGLTFFKLTLYSEWLRESKIWKFISLVMVLWFFGFLAFMWYAAQKQGDASIAGVTLVKVDPDAPKPWQFAFVLLLFAYAKELYSIMTYGDAFDDTMLPSWDSVKKLFPQEYKTASTKSIIEEGSSLLRFGFAPFQFEPNFDIVPEGRLWLLTDSATHLRSVMLVCGFINAQMKKRSEFDQTKTVKQYRDEYKDDPKLLEDSLPFEYIDEMPISDVVALNYFLCNGLEAPRNV